jgi:hypothetical protein
MKNIFFFFLLCAFTVSGISYAQIPNAGFEDWQTDPDGNNNPVGWQTTNSYPIINVDTLSPGCQGNFAMTVKTINVGFSFPGVAILDTVYNFIQRPTKFYACVKSNIMAGDQAYIMLALMKGDSAVAAMDSCTFKINSTISQFTTIEFPIAYISNLLPDSLIIIIASGLVGGQVGTELTVDEIGFIYGSTDVQDNQNPPGDFKLYQNFPNPFNPTTKISWQSPVSSWQTLKVYDLLGREVATLVDEFRPAGSYEVEFNASRLSSGIYFYKLQSGSFIETKKMIVLK